MKSISVRIETRAGLDRLKLELASLLYLSAVFWGRMNKNNRSAHAS